MYSRTQVGFILFPEQFSGALGLWTSPAVLCFVTEEPKGRRAKWVHMISGHWDFHKRRACLQNVHGWVNCKTPSSLQGYLYHHHTNHKLFFAAFTRTSWRISSNSDFHMCRAEAGCRYPSGIFLFYYRGADWNTSGDRLQQQGKHSVHSCGSSSWDSTPESLGQHAAWILSTLREQALF